MYEDRPIKILLVEDDIAHAEMVRRALSDLEARIELHHCQDGQAALDFLFRHAAYADPADSPTPDLILLDLRLPKVDGIEVLSQMQKTENLKHIPVVVLSTSNVESDVLKGYENGAGSYLVKPLNYEKFRSLMAAFGMYWLAWNRFPGRATDPGATRWAP